VVASRIMATTTLDAVVDPSGEKAESREPHLHRESDAVIYRSPKNTRGVNQEGKTINYP
jgi:hypothetical protein